MENVSLAREMIKIQLHDVSFTHQKIKSQSSDEWVLFTDATVKIYPFNWYFYYYLSLYTHRRLRKAAVCKQEKPPGR